MVEHVSSFCWQIDNWQKGYFREWSNINQFDRQSVEAKRYDIGFKLLQQIKYFGNRSDALPEWKEVSRISDVESLQRIWTDLPILTKDHLRSNFIASEIPTRFNLKGINSSTGGSTGEPISYFHDESMLKSLGATILYAHMSMGWRCGFPLIIVWGSERDIGKRRSLRGMLSDLIRNIFWVDGYEMSSQTIEKLRRLLIRHRRGVAIWGFSSMLDFVARSFLEKGIQQLGTVKVAWNGGEMLLENHSKIFQKAFGVPILNFYGSRELGTMAFQKGISRPLKVLRPSLYLEIVDNNGKPVASGEVGRMVWTSTICKGTPFIRYDNGDLGAYSDKGYDESGVFEIAELHGRSAGLLTLPNGKIINCLYWNHLFKEFPDVVQFQVIIQQNGNIRLLLKGQQFAEYRENYFRQILSNRLEHTDVKISWVDNIPLTSQGKLIQVVREA